MNPETSTLNQVRPAALRERDKIQLRIQGYCKFVYIYDVPSTHVCMRRY